MKNPYIIPAAMICATILAGIWMLKSPSEQPQKVVIVQVPDISLIEAAAKGNIEAVKQHLAAGTDVNEKATLGRGTSLHTAAAWGQKEVAELLIANGADVNAKSDIGETPLNDAIGTDHPKIADLLRKHGGKTAKELKAEAK